jgi:glycerol-3-phosphate acyltransferase PlsX
VKIALDAMGGDHSPREIVHGAVQAAQLMSHSILLVGQPEEIAKYLPTPCPANLSIHPASEVVEMHEKPLEALRRTKDSSISVAVELVKKGEASVFVSAGNTGACAAASTLGWRQMHGFHRGALASEIPNYHGKFLLLDAGASPDVDPDHLVEFALMGRAYSKCVLGRENPKVHLLNIGEEAGKGNAFAKQAFNLLSNYPWFAGNIEGNHMFQTPCDVIVCEAFVGNIVLKTSEGAAELIGRLVKEGVPEGPRRMLYSAVKKVFGPIRQKMDYAEIGGSPLLGLNHLCIICHGRSDARAIKNALLLAQRAIDNDLIEALRDSVGKELGA